MSKTVLFPINVQALCVGTSGDQEQENFIQREQNFTELYNEYNTDGDPPISDSMLRGPFDGEHNLATGIHLHWTLPDAINHIASNEHSEEVPKVPNRWLIARLQLKEDGTINPAFWVLESNYLVYPDNHQYDKTGTSVPHLEGYDEDDYTYRFLGKVFDFEKWQPEEMLEENDEYSDQLTALGFGQLHFSALYPNCNTVFGFHDKLEDIDQGNISYSIIGWHAEAEDDLVKSRNKVFEKVVAPMLEKMQEKLLQEGQMTFDAEDYDSAIYHGLVYHIGWDKTKNYLGQEKDQKISANISIGNSQEEAFSAMHTNEHAPTEKALTLLQHGFLKEIDNTTIDQLEERLFDGTFNATSGGVNWSLEIDEATPADQLSDTDLDLSELNRIQSEWEEVKREYNFFKWMAFSDWYKYTYQTYQKNQEGQQRPFPTSDFDHDKYEEIKARFATDPAFEVLKEKYENFSFDDSALATKLNKLADIKDDITLNYDNKDYTIDDYLEKVEETYLSKIESTYPKTKAQSKTSFFAPLDPAILIKLPKNNWLFAGKRNQPEGDEPLIRTVDQILDIESPDLPKAEAPDHWSQNWSWEIINKLLGEAAYYASSETLFSGSGKEPEPFSRIVWAENPCLPLMLDWEVEYVTRGEGSKKNFAPSFFQDYFEFDQDNNLQYQKKVWDSYQKSAFSGRCVLNDYIRQNEKNIQKEMGDKDHPENKVLDPNFFYLSQQLDGFSSNLLMRRKSIELDIVDPKNADIDLINDFINQQNAYSPLFGNTYSPVRNGLFRILNLRIIDAFGQIKNIDIQNEFYASSIKRDADYKEIIKAPDVVSDNYGALLPPRICQPARFNFDFLPAAVQAANETASDPLDHAIYGWIVPNYLEHALMLYDVEGMPVGNLEESVKGSVSLEKNIGSASSTLPVSKEIQTVIDYFTSNKPELLKHFISMHQDTLKDMTPDGKHSGYQLQLLAGRPIAISKVRMSVELMDLPAPDLSWAAMQLNTFVANQIDSKQLPVNRKFSELKIPVRLGNKKNKSDGLIGFFSEDKENTNFHTPYYDEELTPEFKKDCVIPVPFSYPQGTIVKQESHSLSKTQREAIILMDPELKIEGTTGLLPKKRLQLTQAAVTNVIENLKYSFFINPIISESENIGIPTLNMEKMQWAWIEQKSSESDAQQNAEKSWTKPMPTIPPLGVISNNLRIREGWLSLDDKKEKNAK